MKALVYTGVEQMAYRDAPMPVAAQGELLVRIHASGICGSDMHAYLGHDTRRPAPLILGHEASGVVVGGPQDGRRVTINPLVTCGTCEACTTGRSNLCASRQIISMPPREGAFAEYVTMPESNLVTVSDNVPLETAALAEPLAVSWHSVRLGVQALDRPADQARCMVIGGGAIGVAAALSLAAFGANEVTVVEPNPLRRTALEQIGGFAVTDTATGAAHLVIDAVGYAATRATASAVATPGGVIVHIGLGEDMGGLDIRRMTLQEITFIGTYTYTAADFIDTAQAIFNGTLGALDWIQTRALKDGQAAFADIRAGKTPAPKIILIPDHKE